MNTRKFSKKQEKQVAKNLGGKVQPNSGALPLKKGDVEIKDLFLLDCKTSIDYKKSFSVKEKEIEKLEQERITMLKPYKALVFNFGPGRENKYVVDEEVIKEFIEMKEQLNDLS
jgi:hypothetical protein